MSDQRKHSAPATTAQASSTLEGADMPRARKPYQRPTIEKRRSLIQATLFSGTASGGSAPTGAGG